MEAKSLRRELATAGCDALLVVATSSSDPDMAPFIDGARLGETFLIATREAAPQLGYLSPMEREEAEGTGLPILDPAKLHLREIEAGVDTRGEVWGLLLERAFSLLAIAPCRLAVGGRFFNGELYSALSHLERLGWRVQSANEILRRLRRRKSRADLDEIRRAARATKDAFRRVAALLRRSSSRQGELWLDGERLRIRRLRSTIAVCFADHEVREVEGNLVAAGEEGAVPHSGGSSDRVLRVGESLIVDLFPKAKLFADCTRTFCVGQASTRLAAAHAAVLEALRTAHSHVRPGVRGWDLQRRICELLQARGHPTPISAPGTEAGYVHGLGHGVGYELHEVPHFRKNGSLDDGILREGDVLTLEPGLYYPNEGFAVRLEDLLYLGPNGSENLTDLPYDLDPQKWPTTVE